MGRAPCCEKVGLKRGKWTAEEDEILRKYIETNGEGSWRSLPRNAGLLRCGKSCRLRWINYLKSDLKRGNFTAAEEELIFNLHTSMGNKWSLIAGHLPGRTDNEIKNYWTSHLSRKTYIFRRRPNPPFIPPSIAGKPERRKSSKKNNKQSDRKNNSKEKSNNSGIEIMPTTPTPEKESFPTTGDIIPEGMKMRMGMESGDSSLDDIIEDLEGILNSGELEESGLGMELEKYEEWNLNSREWDWGQEEDTFPWFWENAGEESGKTASFDDGSISFGSDTEKHMEGILNSGELEESGLGMELEKYEEWNLNSREWDWGQEEDTFSWFWENAGEESGKTASFDDGSISFGSDTEKHTEGILNSGELEESGLGIELEKYEEWNLNSREWDWGQEEDTFSWFWENAGEESGKTTSFDDGSISFGSDTEKHMEGILNSGELEESGLGMELEKYEEWNLNSREWDWGQEEDTFSWFWENAGEESGKTASFDDGSISFGSDTEKHMEGILNSGELEESGLGMELEKYEEWNLNSREWDWGQEEDTFSWFWENAGEESGKTASFDDGSISFGSDTEKHMEGILNSGELEESGLGMELEKYEEWNLNSREWDWGQEEDTFSWFWENAREESGKTTSFDDGSISFGSDTEKHNGLVSWLMS